MIYVVKAMAILILLVVAEIVRTAFLCGTSEGSEECDA